MKATGIVRRMDDLGRVVIPKEIRRSLRLEAGCPLELFVAEGGSVVFKKYNPIGGFDSDLVTRICNAGLSGNLYTIFDVDGERVLSNYSDSLERIYLDEQLPAGTFPICYDGECLGYIQSGNPNAGYLAHIIGELIANPHSPN